jgi:hypothetical protein
MELGTKQRLVWLKLVKRAKPQLELVVIDVAAGYGTRTKMWRLGPS